MSFITTISGRKYDYSRPHEWVHLEDIALALSHTCRFMGHCEPFYSVAEHSCRVALQCPDELRLDGLLHDAHEAYIGDFATPLKSELRGFDSLENFLARAVRRHFCVSQETVAAVHAADRILFATEARDLTKIDPELYSSIEPLTAHVTPWPMGVARSRFLYYFRQFTETREVNPR